MSDQTPIKGYTPLDLTKHAELAARCLAGPTGSFDDPTINANIMRMRPTVSVVVRLRGRPPLRITLEELP